MVSNNFARCIAKITGDGNLYKTKYVRYNNTSDILLNEFKKDIRLEFGKLNFTEGVGNSGTKFVQTSNHLVIAEFLKYLSSYKSNDVYIPEQIVKSDFFVQKAYLRSLYDDEGCASFRIFSKNNEWKRSLTLTSNSVRLLNDVKKILFNRFGIITNNIIRNRSGSDYDKSWVLGISGKDNLIKFKNNINFKLPYKRKNLNLMILSYGNTYARNRFGFEKIKKKMD